MNCENCRALLRFNFKYLFFIVLSILVVGCDSRSEAENNRVIFSLPDGWDVVAKEQYTDRESVGIVTRLGTMVSIETKGCGASGDLVTLEGCMRRYISVSLPSDEALMSADIEVSKVTRASFDGLSAIITVPSPYNVSYVLEVYKVERVGGLVFVIFNTNSSFLDDLQEDFDGFVKSVEL